MHVLMETIALHDRVHCNDHEDTQKVAQQSIYYQESTDPTEGKERTAISKSSSFY